MVAPSIVKKIVESINNPSNDASENLPIEFYELREMAKRRVLLRDSVKMDATVYFIANAFLILLNILLKPIHSIFDLWALWFAIPWGVFLWIHLWVYLTDTEPNYRKKMFKIDIAMVIAINPFLIFVNYSINYHNGTLATFPIGFWWHWTLLLSLIVVIIHYYLISNVKENKKLDDSVQKEIINIAKKEGLDLNLTKLQHYDQESKTNQNSELD